MIAVELQEMFEDTRRVIRNTTQLINNTQHEPHNSVITVNLQLTDKRL